MPLTLALLALVQGPAARAAEGRDEVGRGPQPATFAVWNRPISSRSEAVGEEAGGLRRGGEQRRLADLSELELAQLITSRGAASRMRTAFIMN